MFSQSIVFEQPVNELVRVCLRLEHLLQLAQHGLRGNSVYDTRAAMAALMDILTLTDRPDLRGKFTKELVRQAANLQRFVHQDHIDQNKLQNTLNDLDQVIQVLQNNNGKFAQSLRENEFLMSIRQHLGMPGGSCSFDTPGYFYWLQQPLKERQTALVQWLSEFEDLFQIVHLLLRLIRQSAGPHLHTAHGGFYQTSLDPQIASQLIRVGVANTIPVLPEISVGRHGVSIRFYHPTTKGRAVPYESDVAFYLTCCVL